MQTSSITPLDLAWEAVNALNGVTTSNVPADIAYAAALDAALAEIEKLGGSDPAARRHAQAMAAMDSKLDRQNGGNVVQIGDHDPEYARKMDATRLHMGAKQ